jgi:hypothetical protein
LLNVDLISKQLPHNMLHVFKEENVYVRKLRGKDVFAVWWTEDKLSAHGRGVQKHGKKRNM